MINPVELANIAQKLGVHLEFNEAPSGPTLAAHPTESKSRFVGGLCGAVGLQITRKIRHLLDGLGGERAASHVALAATRIECPDPYRTVIAVAIARNEQKRER